jgi:hypothetical protein
MSGYNYWTKHGERGVMIKDNDEEENDDNYPMYPEYGDSAMEDNEEEEAKERASYEAADDLVGPLLMHIYTAKVKKRGTSWSAC